MHGSDDMTTIMIMVMIIKNNFNFIHAIKRSLRSNIELRMFWHILVILLLINFLHNEI